MATPQAARKSFGAVGKVPLEQAKGAAGTFLAHAKWRHQERAMRRPGPAASSLMRPPLPRINGHPVMPTLRRRIKEDVLGGIFEPLANLRAH
jgi:hypothetical protein